MSLLYSTQANALIVGAGQGIGLGFVKQLLQDDRISKIYACCRQLETASELSNIQTESPDKLTLLAMDITEELQISEAVKKISGEIQKLHLVVNCVGLLHADGLQPEKSLKQINSENLLCYFQVNSIGAVLLAKHLLPLFRHQETSVFASISAKVGSISDNQLGGWYGYRASKAALNMFVKNIALEYARTCPNTIVVSLHPGTTDTRLSLPFQKNVPAEKLFSVEKTVSLLLAVIEQLQQEDSGEFFSWDGTRLPW